MAIDRTATPVKGLRFKHSRVIDYDKNPAIFQVTRIAQGMVYYRPVYNYGTREVLGHPDCCYLEYFPKVCLEVQS
jgi:hypothetical protein